MSDFKSVVIDGIEYVPRITLMFHVNISYI